jgi:hypothetical protein
VALSGGCFQNALLRDLAESGLAAAGFRVLAPRALSPNDGAIAAGQALGALWNLTTVELPVAGAAADAAPGSGAIMASAPAFPPAPPPPTMVADVPIGDSAGRSAVRQRAPTRMHDSAAP